MINIKAPTERGITYVHDNATREYFFHFNKELFHRSRNANHIGNY
jgi:hypothetical protein